MKKIFVLIAILISVTASSQGIKKPAGQKQPQTVTGQTGLDSVIIKGSYRTDTAKVILVLFVEDGTLAWRKGYTIATYFVPTAKGVNPAIVSQRIVDKDFTPFKEDDVYDIRQQIWK